MHYYNQYGLNGDIRQKKEALETLFGTAFQERDSSYIGIYHQIRIDYDTRVILYISGEAIMDEVETPEYGAILKTNNINDQATLAKIEEELGAVLLKSETLTDAEFEDDDD